MSQTVRIVLQARMGSLRRPGKTLADIAGNREALAALLGLPGKIAEQA